MHRISRTLGLAAGLFSLAALATGADGSWTRCAAPARLAPNPGGRTFYVSPTGTDPGSCSVGYTFRTINAAVLCAQGKDTIVVHGGTYPPVRIYNFYPSDWVLITNASGETPVIDGGGILGDYDSVFYIGGASKLAVQGLEIKNTGIPKNTDGTLNRQQGAYGLKADNVTYLRLYYNTIHDVARHGITTDGHQIEVVGNHVYNAVMRNQNFLAVGSHCPTGMSCYWDGGVSSGTARNQWGYTVRGNLVHDIWGECIDVLAVDGATVEGNRVYSCVNVNIYVSESQNVTLNRNWVSDVSTSFIDPSTGEHPTAIQLSNESKTRGWSLSNIAITNNILEWVGRAIRYANSPKRSPGDGGPIDTYNGVYIGFNDMNRTFHGPMMFDTPDQQPTVQNKIAGNLVINITSGGAGWIYAPDPNFWSYWVYPPPNNWNYGTSVTSTNPGINDYYGTYLTAYDWKAGAEARWQIGPYQEPDMPSSDYHCSSHGQNNWNSPGAVN